MTPKTKAAGFVLGQTFTDGYVYVNSLFSATDYGTNFFSFQTNSVQFYSVGVLGSNVHLDPSNYPLATSTATSTLNNISFLVQQDPNMSVSQSASLGTTIYCKDSTGADISISEININPYTLADISSSNWTPVQFFYDTTNTCDLRYPIQSIQLNTSLTGADTKAFRIKATDITSPRLSAADDGYGIGAGYEGHAFYFVINNNVNLVNETTAGTSNVSLNNCLPTDFKINFGFGEVDFGNGFCNLFTYLALPTQQDLTDYDTTIQKVNSKAPFSYFADISNIIASSTSPSFATMTPLTLTVGTTTPHGLHFSFDIFSTDTMNKYTSTTSRGVIRVVLQYALYLMFASMIIIEVRHLFRGGGQQK